MRKQSFFPVSQFSTDQNIGAQSLRAAEKKIARETKSCETQILVVKMWFDKNSRFILHIVFIKILSFFGSRRRQAATFLHGAERVAQMTQKALQLALNVSNEAWEDATVDNLVTYLDNYT